jgi:hypothetical protein
MESIGFTCIFFTANFHVFYTEKTSLERKNNFRLSRGVAGGFLDEIWGAESSAVLESWNFGYQPDLSQLGVPHTQNFEILKFL